ncbi:MAG: TldD/PmbA family protein [Clostridiales bacterium]|nr:TldD/PmbA family protein [Clostridiales bacterium]
MLDQNLAREVLACAVRTGGDFAEIFMEDRVDHALLMRSGRIETVNTGRIHGAGVRVFSGTNAIYVHTNDTSRQGLLACAEQAAAAVKVGSGCVVEAFKPSCWVRPEEIRILPTDVKANVKAEKIRAAEAAARRVSPEIVQVNVNYIDHVQDVLICNTEGVFATDRRVRTRMSVGAVASNGAEIQTGTEGPGAAMGFEIFDERIDPEKVGEAAAKQAVTMLHAPLCPAGVMPVVIDNGFGGVIFHEACGHSLEATSVAFGVSEFSGKLGQMVAAPCVTAIDDGTMLNEWGSLHIDDEGMPTTRLTLIENGVLKNYMIDKLGGRRMNMAPTGSGRRQSYAWAPTSRMRNTFIAAGKDDEAEMIATMGDGLYAKKMGGGSVNPATGEFNFAVNEGYLVKDGKIAHPVRGASLIGRGSEVLLKIDRVGRDMQMGQGMCGSSSGSIPTNVGQPMIRVSSLTVGGQG